MWHTGAVIWFELDIMCIYTRHLLTFESSWGISPVLHTGAAISYLLLLIFMTAYDETDNVYQDTLRCYTLHVLHTCAYVD